MGDDLSRTLMLLPTLLQSLMAPMTSMFSSATGTNLGSTTNADTEYNNAVQMLAFDTSDIVDLSETQRAGYQQIVEEHEAEIARARQLGASEEAIGNIVDSVTGIITLLDELGVINLPETRNGTTASTWLTAIGDALTETGFSIYRAWGGKGSGDDSEETEATNTKNPRDVKYSEISGTNSYGINQNAWNAAGLDPAAFASFDTDGSGYVSYMEYVQGGGKR